MTTKYNQTTWHSAANSGSYTDDTKSTTPARRYVPSVAKRRQWARNSKDGGRATCDVCHETFAMSYMRNVRLANFRHGFACMDCTKDHNLTKV